MDQRVLGGTGLTVSAFGFGAMNLGAWGSTTQTDADTLVGQALDAGITLFDTADIYSSGESEQLLGKALGERREGIVLATKGRNSLTDNPLEGGASRRWLTKALEDSLRRLGTDYVDLYQVHRPDWATDHDETLAALTDLQAAGKIRAFGSSTYPAHAVVEAQWIARDRGLSRFTTEQVAYSIFDRSVEADLFPVAQQYRMGILIWSPLANGWLAGAVTRDHADTHRSVLGGGFDLSTAESQRKLDIVDTLHGIADELGVTLAALSLAFVNAHPAVTSVLLGPRTQQHLQANLKAADIVLEDDVLDRIDQLVTPGTDVAVADRYLVPLPQLAETRLRRR